MLLNSYPQKDAEENFNHAAKQAYCICTSNYCCCSKKLTTPLEGFDADALDEILG
jgi:hypothetical protein